MSEIIKAISLWQPWASLWLTSKKRHETRHWSTAYRGKMLVHAARRLGEDLDDELCGLLVDEFGRDWSGVLRYGAIVGMVDLVDVVRTERVYPGHRSEDEIVDMMCGDFSDGRFGWRRGTYWVFPEPIPYRGHQRIFNVSRSVVAGQIAAAKEVCGG